MMYDQNQQMLNNGFAGFAPMGSGFQYNGMSQPITKRSNILSADEIAQLMRKENQFSLALTETEKLRAACSHQKADGSGDSLIENEDGTTSCTICGYTFKPLDAHMTTKEDIESAVAIVIDMLQTVKLIWIDMDGPVGREYFQIIPLLEKLPQVFDIAVKNYSKHEGMMPWSNANRNMSTMQAFAMLNSMLNGGGAAQYYGAPQQMNFAQAPQQPQYQPNFQMYGQVPTQPQPMTNGFGYVGQGPMYQPQTNGYQTVYGQVPPQQPQAPVNPAPAPATEAKEEKTVSKTMKA